MTNLFIIDELYTSGFKTGILDIISLFIILCGVLIIISLTILKITHKYNYNYLFEKSEGVNIIVKKK